MKKDYQAPIAEIVYFVIPDAVLTSAIPDFRDDIFGLESREGAGE